MLEISPINLHSQSFQAKPTSTKLVGQKLKRAVNDKNLSETTRKNLEQVTNNSIPMTELKSQLITDFVTFCS